MPRDVLILATKYDRATSRTFEWAKELQGMLFPYVDSCLFVEVTGLCRAGPALKEFLKIATHVIFYGHGEANWWTALPGNPDTELIGSGTVHMLGKHEVYAVCCSSLSGLGTIHSQKCNGNYVGYDDRFRFDLDNEVEFKQIVNQSAFNFVVTGNALQTVTDLKNEWARLANDFAGPLKLRKSAGMAGSFAQTNGQRIGSKP